MPSTYLFTHARSLTTEKSSNITPFDTRPIAQLPESAKLLENIVHTQLLKHLEQNHLLDDREAGFRRGHSTQTGLLVVLEDMRVAID